MGSGIRFVAQFGIGIALARLLPPEDFGIVGMAYIVTGFAGVVSQLGLGPALIQREEITERHIRVCFTLSTLMGVLIAALCYAVANPVADFFHESRVAPVLRVLAWTFLFTGFGITSEALLRREMRFKTTVRIELVSSILGYGLVAVTLAVLGYGYWALVFGTLCQTAISAILSNLAARHSISLLIANQEVRDLFSFSAGMSLTSIANYFARQGDYFVVGRLMPAASLGYYTRAYNLMQLPLTFFGRAVGSVVFPAVSRVQNDQLRLGRAYLTAFSMSWAIALSMSVIICILAPEFVVCLYGSTWEPAAPLLSILSMFGCFRMTLNTTGEIVRACGFPLRLFACQIIYGVLVVAGSWFAAGQAGLPGVAWAVGVAILITWVTTTYFANLATNVSFRDVVRSIISSSLPALTTGTILWAVVSSMRRHRLPLEYILMTGLGFAIPISFWLLFRMARRQDHPGINRVLNRVLQRFNDNCNFVAKSLRTALRD